MNVSQLIFVEPHRQYCAGPPAAISSTCLPSSHQQPIGLLGFRLGYGLPLGPHRAAAAGTVVLSNSNRKNNSRLNLIFDFGSYCHNHSMLYIHSCMNKHNKSVGYQVLEQDHQFLHKYLVNRNLGVDNLS
jgi:hypothetical protein